MERVKRAAVVVLSALLLVVTTACAKKPERRLAEAFEKLGEMQSYTMDMALGVTLALTSQEETLPIDLALSADVASTLRPLAMHVGVSAKSFGFVGAIVEGYIMTGEYGSLAVYIREMPDGPWQIRYIDTVGTPISGGANPQVNMGNLPLTALRVAGSEEVNGQKAQIIHGKLDIDRFWAAVSLAARMQLGGGEETDRMLGVVRSFLEGMEIKFYLSQSDGRLLKARVDLPNDDSLLNQLIADALEGELTGDFEGAVSLENIYMEITLSDIDNTGPIVVPDEALNAPVVTEGVQDLPTDSL